MKRLRKTMKGSVTVTGYQSHSQGLQVSAMYPLKVWMQPLGFCKILKKNMLISPLKNVWHTITVMYCLFWKTMGRNNSFSKRRIYAGGFVPCYRLHYETKVLILWSWQRCLLHLCLPFIYIYIHTHTYIYTHTHTHTHTHSRRICITEHHIRICSHTGSHCTHCVHGLATG